MITVGLDGLFAPTLERGLAREALAPFEPDLRRARADLAGRLGGEAGLFGAPTQPDVIKSIKTEAKRLRSLADDLLVLGMGGSSLGGQALTWALHYFSDREVRIHYIDNIDPDRIAFLLNRLEPARTAVLVASKSGTTIETLTQLLIVRRWFRASIGQGESRSRTVFITDPETGLLRELANTEGIRSFAVPPEVGGRFAALTPVGLLPAAFLNIDLDAICAGASAMVARVQAEVDDLWQCPAARFAGATLLAQQQLGRQVLVMMPYSDALRAMSNWFVQLWAQSLGRGRGQEGEAVIAGQTPIAGIGSCDQYCQLQLFLEGPADKLVVLVSPDEANQPFPIPDELAEREEVSYLHQHDLRDVLDAQRRATRAALLNAGVPVIDLRLPRVDEASVGGLVVLLTASCVLAGYARGIDPFAPAGIEAQQRLAWGLLGREGFADEAQGVLARESRSDAQS